MISDRKLIELINGRENQNVDFKIRCDALASQNKQPNGELVKDICAFANNGNVSNYLIIGISDDGSQFDSVKNCNLEDAKIQDLCLKSIFPPPKIRVFKKKWKTGGISKIDVELVIIQIGPHKRQAYRLSKDFIDNSGKTYFRKNEVWIRRGTVVDTATPEEVARLVAGKEPIEPIIDEERKNERVSFISLSQYQKFEVIDGTIKKVLRKNKCLKIPKRNRPLCEISYGVKTSPDYYWIKNQSSLILIDIAHCQEKFNKMDSHNLMWKINREYSLRDNHFLSFMKKIPGITNIRRLYIVPVLGKVNRNRIQEFLPNWQWTGRQLNFFLPDTEIPQYKKEKELFPISTKLLIIDSIYSSPDFYERFDEEFTFFNS